MAVANFQGAHFQGPRSLEQLGQPTPFDEKKAHFTKIIESLDTDNKLSAEELLEIEAITKEQNARLKAARGYYLTGTLDGDVDYEEPITNSTFEDFNQLLAKTDIPTLKENIEINNYIVELDADIDRTLNQGSKGLRAMVLDLRALMGKFIKQLGVKKQEHREGNDSVPVTNGDERKILYINEDGTAVYEDNTAKIRDEALSILKNHELLQRIIIIDMILTKTTTMDITDILSKENFMDILHNMAKQTQLVKKNVLLQGKALTDHISGQIEKLRIKVSSSVKKSVDAFDALTTALSNTVDGVAATCMPKLIAFDGAIRAIIKKIIEETNPIIAIQCHNLTAFDSQRTNRIVDQQLSLNNVRVKVLENNICKLIFQCSEWSIEQSPEKFSCNILKQLLDKNTTVAEKEVCIEVYYKLLDEFVKSTTPNEQCQSIKALTSYVLDKVYAHNSLGVNRIGCVDLLKDVRLVIEQLNTLASNAENNDCQKLITHLKEQSYAFVKLRAQDTKLNRSYFCEIEKDDGVESDKDILAKIESVKLEYVNNFKAYVAGKKPQYQGVLYSSLAYTISSDVAAIKKSWRDAVYFFNLNGRAFDRKLYYIIGASDFLTKICRTDTLTNKVDKILRSIRVGTSNVGASINTFISENRFKSQSYNNYDFTTPSKIEASIDMYEKYVNLLTKVVGSCDSVSGDELEVSKLIQYIIERKEALPKMEKGDKPEFTTTTKRNLKSFVENVLLELTVPSTFAARHIDFLELTDSVESDGVSTAPGSTDDSASSHSSEDDLVTDDSVTNNSVTNNFHTQPEGVQDIDALQSTSNTTNLPIQQITKPTIEAWKSYWLDQPRDTHTLQDTIRILNPESMQLTEDTLSELTRIHKKLVELKEKTKYGLENDVKFFLSMVNIIFYRVISNHFEDKYVTQTQTSGGGILDFFGISSKETILNDINTIAEKQDAGVLRRGNDTLESKRLAIQYAVGEFLAPIDRDLENNIVQSNLFTLDNLSGKSQTFKSEAMAVIHQDYLKFVRQRMVEPLMALKRMVAVHVITLSAFKLLQKVKLSKDFTLRQEPDVEVRNIGTELIEDLAITDKTTYDSLLKPGSPLTDLIKYITNGLSEVNSIEKQKELYDKLTKWLYYLSRTYQHPSVIDTLVQASSLDKFNLPTLLEQLHIHIDNTVGVNNIIRTSDAKAPEDIELVGSIDRTSARHATVTVVDMISKTLTLLTADQVESADGKFRIEKFSSNVIYQKFQDTLSSVSAIVSMYGGMNLAARRLNCLAKTTFLVREQLISKDMIEQILKLDSIHRTMMKRNDVNNTDKQVLQTRFDEAIKIMNEPMSVILKLYGGLNKLSPQGLPVILIELYDKIFVDPFQSINAMYHYGASNKRNLREQVSSTVNRIKTLARNRQIDGTTQQNIQYNLVKLQEADARLVAILTIFNKIITIKYVGEPDKNTAIETLFTELEIYDRTIEEKEPLSNRFRTSMKTFLDLVDRFTGRSDANSQNNNVKDLVQKVLGELGLNKTLDINGLINANINRSINLKRKVLNEKSLKDNIKGEYLTKLNDIDMESQATKFLSAELAIKLKNMQEEPKTRDISITYLVKDLTDILNKIFELTALDNTYRHLLATETRGTLIKYNNPQADPHLVTGGGIDMNEVEAIVRKTAMKLPSSKFSEKDIKAIVADTKVDLKNADSSPLKGTVSNANSVLAKLKNYKSNLADKIKTALTLATRDQGLNSTPQTPAYNDQRERVRVNYQPERVDDSRMATIEDQDQGSVLTQPIVLVSLGVSFLAAVGFALFN